MNVNTSNESSQLQGRHGRVKFRAVAGGGAVAVKLIEPRPGHLLLTDRAPSRLLKVEGWIKPFSRQAPHYTHKSAIHSTNYTVRLSIDRLLRQTARSNGVNSPGDACDGAHM